VHDPTWQLKRKVAKAVNYLTTKYKAMSSNLQDQRVGVGRDTERERFVYFLNHNTLGFPSYPNPIHSLVSGFPQLA
jgi:hypothetical protein